MRKAIVLLAVVLVVGTIPPTMARHRSVGFEDNVVGQEDEPTVPNADQIEGDVDETPFGVGTTHPDDCSNVEGNVSEEAVQNATTADEYCGELVYNPEVGELTVFSQPDQDIRTDKIESFDVVFSDLAGVPGGLTLCWPFCPPAGDFPLDTLNPPGGNDRHELFYDTMAETGLTHDSEETKDNQRQNRRNYVSAQVSYPNAGMTVQDQTGIWEMNGWVTPTATSTFVAFLFADGGEAIGPDELSTIVTNEKAKDDGLVDGAVPKVCGFTEDREPSTTKSDALCEIELKHFSPRETDGIDDVHFKNYGDRCQSPTYVCNNIGGPAWRASPPPFTGSSASPPLGVAEGPYEPPGPLSFSDLGDGDKFVTWHWVVAPAPQECPAQEPGVLLNAGETGDPYLAHDLDSYVPVTRTSAADTPSPGHLQTYAEKIGAGPIDTVQRTVEDNAGPAQDIVDEVNAAVEGAREDVNGTQDATIQDISKADRLEPNAATGDKNPFADTSRDKVTVDQGLNSCIKVTTGEDEETADPWVDYIDSEITHTRTVAVNESIGFEGSNTLYGNTADNQDENNNPGPTRLSTAGHVGIFTDNDNDDAYDPIEDPYVPASIEEAGAYPMLWDVRVNATDGPSITEETSCAFTDNQNTVLSNEAQKLGYGPNTGLYQLVYLPQPTAVDASLLATEDRFVYPGGNNIYVLASQSVRELTDDDYDDTPDSQLEEQFDGAVTDLQSWVVSNVDGVDDAPDVQKPGAEFGFTSDFTHQCTAGVETGEFNSQLSFVHDCQSLSCEGATVVTNYVFEVTTSDGTFDEGQTNIIPAFSSINTNTESFGGFAPFNVWTDVDPLDGDPARNDADTPAPQ